jgi:hypothetical protein
VDVDVHIVDIVGHDSYSRQVHSYDKPVGCNDNPNNTVLRYDHWAISWREEHEPYLRPQGLKLQVASNLDGNGVVAYKSVPLSITPLK